jgi:soluble lytic murein transglycosylase-like protein
MLAPAAAAAVPVQRASPSCAGLRVFDEPIARAAARFAISDALIRAVIAVESNFKVFAISPKGAMGLMQLMPGTWEELRQRYRLGSDPFDPCDNILAGSAYLRELLDRYGDPGFLAAYNAGPGRYQAYLGGRQSLPAETIAYVAKLSGVMLAPGAKPVAREGADPDTWRSSGLFARRSETPSDAPLLTSKTSPELARGEEVPRAQPPRETIFIAREGAPR